MNVLQQLILKSYVVVATIAFTFSIAMLISSKIADGFGPFLGWPIVGLIYGSSVKYAVLPFWGPTVEAKFKCTRVLFWDMIILIIYGLLMLSLSLGGGNENIYLDMTGYQFIWLFLFPLIYGFAFLMFFGIRNGDRPKHLCERL